MRVKCKRQGVFSTVPILDLLKQTLDTILLELATHKLSSTLNYDSYKANGASFFYLQNLSECLIKKKFILGLLSLKHRGNPVIGYSQRLKKSDEEVKRW